MSKKTEFFRITVVETSIKKNPISPKKHIKLLLEKLLG
jgi:hypothetical protein